MAATPDLKLRTPLQPPPATNALSRKPSALLQGPPSGLAETHETELPHLSNAIIRV